MGAKMQPIRDLGEVYRITEELKEMTDDRGRRMYLMWVVGICLGLRIGDLICLKVGDLRGDYFTYLPRKQRHKKMAQAQSYKIPSEVKRAIKDRCSDLPDDAWLLPSRKKRRQAKKNPEKNIPPKENVGAIGRQAALSDMNEIAKRCHVSMKLGCHTMRKTFGYHQYKVSHDIEKLRKWYYHSSPITTTVYIGIDSDELQTMSDKSPFAGMV